MLHGKGVAVMRSQAQRRSREYYRESYFILPTKKQPTVRLLRTLLMTGVLTLIAILAMVIIALSLGMWWDSLGTGWK
jgi:hypothetical protein